MNKSVNEAAPDRRSLAWRRLTAGTLASFALLSLTESSDGVVPNLPTGTKIVAMGDSYTSGHNNGDVHGKFNDCFRDNISYAYKIADQLDLLDSFTNVACSGATQKRLLRVVLTKGHRLNPSTTKPTMCYSPPVQMPQTYQSFLARA